MNDIQVPLPNSARVAHLAQPHGGGIVYHIYIDKWYQGVMQAEQGKWVARLNDKSRLTSKEIAVIIAAIDSQPQ